MYLSACPFLHLFAQMCVFYLTFNLCCNILTSTFSFLLALIFSERCNTKPPAQAKQVRPRDPQTKKQQSATLPASSKLAGGTTAITRHKDGAAGTKKTAKTTGKAGSSTQAKANPRSTNTASRGIGKFNVWGLKPMCLLMFLPACLPACQMCLCHC